jgi:hypothetical protein
MDGWKEEVPVSTGVRTEWMVIVVEGGGGSGMESKRSCH